MMLFTNTLLHRTKLLIQELLAHIAQTYSGSVGGAPHGAATTPTANTIALRTANGRISAQAGVDASDVVVVSQLPPPSGGTVQSVSAGAGLQTSLGPGVPITVSGSLGLPVQTSLVAGEYLYPQISVDPYGRITNVYTDAPVTTIQTSLPLLGAASPTSGAVYLSMNVASNAQSGFLAAADYIRLFAVGSATGSFLSVAIAFPFTTIMNLSGVLYDRWLTVDVVNDRVINNTSIYVIVQVTATVYISNAEPGSTSLSGIAYATINGTGNYGLVGWNTGAYPGTANVTVSTVIGLAAGEWVDIRTTSQAGIGGSSPYSHNIGLATLVVKAIG